MNAELLRSIEWHDLPVQSLSVRADGLELVVTPYSEAGGHYNTVNLRLVDPLVLGLRIEGSLGLSDLRGLEVASFSHSLGPEGLLSGVIGLLPGNAGYWEVSFTSAVWSIEEVRGPTESGGPTGL